MNGKLMKMLCIGVVSTALAGVAIGGRPPGGGGGGQRQPGQGGGDGEQRPPRPDPDKVFDKADANGDGSLSRAEFKEWFTNRPPPPPPRDGEGGNDRPPPPPKE